MCSSLFFHTAQLFVLAESNDVLKLAKFIYSFSILGEIYGTFDNHFRYMYSKNIDFE